MKSNGSNTTCVLGLVELRVRKQIWAYAPDETLDAAALIAEQYQGIRPAPGYPACRNLVANID